MKTNFTKLSIFALVFFGSVSTSSAQQSAISAANSSMQISYAYNSSASVANSSVSSENTLSNEKTVALLKYVRSEQYVFDNLSSLKKMYTVRDIFYDLDQSAIRNDAKETLDGLADLLTEQPELSVAVTAHCDSRMSAYNESLSVKRAESAKAYLISKGIQESRVVIDKHGRAAAPSACATNPGCSIAEQQLNRKTEFNIIVNGKNLAHVKSYQE